MTDAVDAPAQHGSAEHPAVRPRRLAVSGGSRLTNANVPFCEALGRLLARESGLTVVTGGFRCWREAPGQASADWSTVNALCEELKRLAADPETRVETLIPEVDHSSIVRFEAGRNMVLRNRTAQSRRFSLVSSTDAVLCIEGSRGTRQVIDLALALQRPVLPLPFTGGVSAELWKQNREAICDSFRIPDDVAGQLEAQDLAALGRDRLDALAGQVVGHLIPALQRKCLVVMPFAETMLPLYEDGIRPAIVASGLRPVRTDHLDLTGNAVDTLRQAITSCDAAVVVITGWNPNVMYELGLVHAHGKPAIVVCEWGPKRRFTGVPFDLQSERIVGYDSDTEALAGQLQRFLERVFGPAPSRPG